MDMMNGKNRMEGAAWGLSTALALALIIPLIPIVLAIAAIDRLRGKRQNGGS